MAELNLLPWRDELARYQRKKLQRFLIIGALLASLALCQMEVTIKKKLVKQQLQNTHLRSLMQTILNAPTDFYQTKINEVLTKQNQTKTLLQTLFASSKWIHVTYLSRDDQQLILKGESNDTSHLVLAMNGWLQKKILIKPTHIKLQKNASRKIKFILQTKTKD